MIDLTDHPLGKVLDSFQGEYAQRAAASIAVCLCAEFLAMLGPDPDFALDVRKALGQRITELHEWTAANMRKKDHDSGTTQ